MSDTRPYPRECKGMCDGCLRGPGPCWVAVLRWLNAGSRRKEGE